MLGLRFCPVGALAGLVFHHSFHENYIYRTMEAKFLFLLGGKES